MMDRIRNITEWIGQRERERVEVQRVPDRGTKCTAKETETVRESDII